MKIPFTLIFLSALLFYSCDFKFPKAKKIEYTENIQSIVDNFKGELDSEGFRITSGFSSFDTVRTDKVIVSILNAKELPDTDELKDLAKNIALTISPEIINKNEFSLIQVIFHGAHNIGIVKTSSTRNFDFTFEELDNE